MCTQRFMGVLKGTAKEYNGCAYISKRSANDLETMDKCMLTISQLKYMHPVKSLCGNDLGYGFG